MAPNSFCRFTGVVCAMKPRASSLSLRKYSKACHGINSFRPCSEDFKSAARLPILRAKCAAGQFEFADGFHRRVRKQKPAALRARAADASPDFLASALRSVNLRVVVSLDAGASRATTPDFACFLKQREGRSAPASDRVPSPTPTSRFR